MVDMQGFADSLPPDSPKPVRRCLSWDFAARETVDYHPV